MWVRKNTKLSSCCRKVVSCKQKQHIIRTTKNKQTKQKHKLPNLRNPHKQNQSQCGKGSKILKLNGVSKHFSASTRQPSLLRPGKGVALLRCAGVLWHMLLHCSCFSAYCMFRPLTFSLWTLDFPFPPFSSSSL